MLAGPFRPRPCWLVSTVVAYRAPALIVTVKSEDGRVPDDLQMRASFTFNGGGYSESFARQPDGRYCGLSLMPDHEYEIRADGPSREYIQKGLPRVNLLEGGSTQLIVLRKRPAPSEVGQPAPSFSIRALDGRTLSLDGLRGKTVLLHFWAPIFGLQDASVLKAVHQRFGQDRRFAMIGLCLSNESEAAGQSIRTMPLQWPHAVLRDRDLDPIAIAYGPERQYNAFLIGPDGRLIARDLEGQALEKAVAGALAAK
jgi:AhpC/TSA family